MEILKELVDFNVKVTTIEADKAVIVEGILKKVDTKGILVHQSQGNSQLVFIKHCDYTRIVATEEAQSSGGIFEAFKQGKKKGLFEIEK